MIPSFGGWVPSLISFVLSVDRCTIIWQTGMGLEKGEEYEDDR